MARASSPSGPLPYNRFRGAPSFAETRAELKAEQDAAYARGEYMFVSRSTVLGRMHQHKQQAYEYYLSEFERTERNLERLPWVQARAS